MALLFLWHLYVVVEIYSQKVATSAIFICPQVMLSRRSVQ
jgi:hypothetical protein